MRFFKYFRFFSLLAMVVIALISCADEDGPTEIPDGGGDDLSSITTSSAGNNPVSSAVIIPGSSTGGAPNSSNSAGQSSSSGLTQSSGETGTSSSSSLPAVDISDKLANITKTCTSPLPSVGNSTSKGHASRYWDCCKPSCAWPDKFGFDPEKTVKTCDINDNEISTQVETGNQYYPYEGVENSCDGGPAFACYDQAPFAVCEDLAYGYAAASGSALGDAACGSCYLLEFDGGMHNYEPKYEHAALQGKKMIVMVTNIGYDVDEGQFDIMIPGGGMGAFTGGCAAQWGVDLNDENLVGKTFGGFRSTCEEKLGYYPEPTIEQNQQCVRDMCDAMFDKPGLEDMLQGCYWYVDWYYAANNPTYTYAPIECPQELVDNFPTSFPVVDMSGY